MSSVERSGWRDEKISRRHRRWGFNCPATDMDFLLLEFNHGVPVAVVDYKHFSKADPLADLHDSAIAALSGLYDERGENLPFFVARYWPESWAFKALAMNDRARSWLRNEWVAMTEKQWVTGLYRMRKAALDLRDQRYIAQLNDFMPPAERESAA
jgi:hypothetical protein